MTDAFPPASRFAGTLMDLQDRIRYRRISPEDQDDPVYRLRYEAYRREGFVPVNTDGTVHDEFEELVNAYCYGVYIDGTLVSSLRLHRLSKAARMSPSYSVFPDLLDPLVERGDTMIDPGRFTADYDASLAFPALPYLTLRIAVMAVCHWQVKWCLSSVRPEHAAFYRRLFKSTQLGGDRHYHGLSFPMQLWVCDCPVVYPGLIQRYPFFDSTEEERQQIFAAIGAAPSWITPTARNAGTPPEMIAAE